MWLLGAKSARRRYSRTQQRPSINSRLSLRGPRALAPKRRKRLNPNPLIAPKTLAFQSRLQ
jgi:hypothetical protein